MMSHHRSRRMQPPGNNRKRKHPAGPNKPVAPKQAQPKTSNRLQAEPKTSNQILAEPKTSNRFLAEPKTSNRFLAEPKTSNRLLPETKTSNRLLAGYLAHEFLTKGTLFGQKYDPASARAKRAGFVEPKRSQPKLQAADLATEPSRQDLRMEHENYGEVSSIMKTEGTHIKGIVNPTQLSRWIKM